MSTQTQPQLQPQQQPQQQPVVVYPNPVTGQLPPSHSHSNGSFGTVFIVLAVIVVISAVACCLGRLCNRRHNKQKPNNKQNQNQNQNQQSHNPRPKERESDIEFGFEKGFPTARSAKSGDPRGHKPTGNGYMNGHTHTHTRGETNPVDIGEPKAGPTF